MQLLTWNIYFYIFMHVYHHLSHVPQTTSKSIDEDNIFPLGWWLTTYLYGIKQTLILRIVYLNEVVVR